MSTSVTPPTAEAFHDAWVSYGMTCSGTHTVGEALCQNVTAVLAHLAAESPVEPDTLDSVLAEVERVVRKRMHGGVWMSEERVLAIIAELRKA